MQGHKTKLNFEEWDKRQNGKKGINKSVVEPKFEKIDFNQHAPTPLSEQFKPLIVRNLKNFVRTPSNQFGRLMQMICYPLFIGKYWSKMKERYFTTFWITSQHNRI